MSEAESKDEYRIGLATHFRAIERLWLLYRRPRQFLRWIEGKGNPRLQIVTGLLLSLHALPHLIWIALGIRLICFFGIEESRIRYWGSDYSGLLVESTFSIVPFLLVNFYPHPKSSALRRVDARVTISLLFAFNGLFVLLVSLAIGFRLAYYISSLCTLGIVFGIIVQLSNSNVRKYSFPLLLGIGLLLSLPTVLIPSFMGIDTEISANSVGLGLAIFLFFSTRLYYLPYQFFFIWPYIRGRSYRLHPVAWDDCCLIAAPGLGLLLADYDMHDRKKAAREIERLIDEYPSQRDQALRARVRLLARDSADADLISELAMISTQLPTGDRGWLAQTSIVKDGIDLIVRRDAEMRLTTGLPAFVLQSAEAVLHAIETFRTQIAGLHEPLASAFLEASKEWIVLASGKVESAKSIRNKERVTQVFRAGDPVDADGAEAFVPRKEVIDEIKSNLIAGQGCPGLLIYARRRMGKSSCLRNLVGFLPSSIQVVHLNLQAPGICGSEESFCLGLGSAIAMAPDVIPPTNLGELEVFLDSLNGRLGEQGQRLLIGLDEYEYLDVMIGEQNLPIGLLALMRTSIQEHRNLIWVFAGSHQIRELQKKQWASSLISVRTIEIEGFSPQETETLLTHPLEHSKLWPPGADDRPSFAPEFWGINGIQRIQTVSNGWPFFVVYLAETCINLINQGKSAFVSNEIVETAIRKALIGCETAMIQILQNESELEGEWDYLLGFKTKKSQSLPDNPAILSSLQRRLLVDVNDGQVVLRVPLMQMWMEQRA